MVSFFTVRQLFDCTEFQHWYWHFGQLVMNLLGTSNFLLLHKLSSCVFHLFHPGMCGYVSERKPKIYFKLQNLLNEVFDIRRELGIYLIGSFEHWLLDLLYGFALERGYSMQKFIKQYAKGPNINTVVVLGSENHLGSHILIGPAERGSLHAYILGTPTEVTNLDIEILVEQEVLRLGLGYKLLSNPGGLCRCCADSWLHSESGWRTWRLTAR